MDYKRVFWITLCILAFTQAVAPRVVAPSDGAATFTSGSDNDEPTTSKGSLSVLYLEQLLQKFKKSDQRFQNGELNLLSDETKGFANTVHCFLAENNMSQATTDRDANRKTLRFNFNLKPLQSVLATQLVFLVPETTFGSATSMYKVEQNGKPMQALDSKLSPAAIPHKQWLEFSIHYITDDTTTRNLSFNVEIANQNRTLLPSDRELGALLDDIIPLLAVYSHDPVSIGQLAEESLVPELEFEGVRNRKRQAAPLWPTLEDIENEPCQKYQSFLTYQQIGWPSTNVISPPGGLEFAYCYGRCNSPFSEETEYTRHAQLLEASKNYYRQNNLPPPVFPSPCCVPMALTNISMITETADGRIAGKVFQDVARCGCV